MITSRQAAELIRDDYEAGRSKTVGQLAYHASDFGDAARIVEEDGEIILIIRGSDDWLDWARNFRVLGSSWPEAGDSGREYHRGFLKGALEIWGWICGRIDTSTRQKTMYGNRFLPFKKTITTVIGHSRGGAIAGIVGASLNVRTLTFACPRYAYGGGTIEGDAKVRHLVRSDDLITWAPPWLTRPGETVQINQRWKWGESHRIGHYLEALAP